MNPFRAVVGGGYVEMQIYSVVLKKTLYLKVFPKTQNSIQNDLGQVFQWDGVFEVTEKGVVLRLFDVFLQQEQVFMVGLENLETIKQLGAWVSGKVASSQATQASYRPHLVYRPPN